MEIIKVAFVNQPKTPTGKSGSVKTEDGRYLGVFKDKLAQFTPGQSYEVETKSREYNGRTYHDITSAKPVNGSNGNGTHAENGHANGSTSDQIRWQTCLKCAAEVTGRSGIPEGVSLSSQIISIARLLYGATPTEVTAASTTNNGGDW